MSKTKKIKKQTLWTSTWDKSINRYRIRRFVYFIDGSKKQENYPHSAFKSFDKDPEQIEEFLTRENYKQEQEEKAKKSFKIKTSFLKNRIYNRDFEEWMNKRTRNEIYSRAVANSVVNHFVAYFIDQRKIYDFDKWTTSKNEEKFINYLQEKELAYKTIITIKNNCNMFFEYLATLSDNKIKIKPFDFYYFTKSASRRYETDRKKKNKHKDKRLSGNDYVKKEEFKTIYNYCVNADIDGEYKYQVIAPYIWMCYHYGLRRSESMAVDLDCFKKDHLVITRQLSKIDEYDELKHGMPERKIPHILTKGMDQTILGMCNSIQETKMHPTTFTRMFGRVMKDLNMSFTIHNLRNTFITNCFYEKMLPIEIMHAAGHSDLKTTMKYVRDAREFGDEKVEFDPSKFDLKDAV